MKVFYNLQRCVGFLVLFSILLAACVNHISEEEEAGVVSVRSRFAGDEGQKDLTAFMDALKEEIDTKTIREVEKED